jgi:predicted dehydrogenase
MQTAITRRQVLVGAAAAAIAPRLIRTADGQTADRLRFGFIGVGGRGTYLLRLILQIPEVRVTAICDINEGNLKRAIKMVSDKDGSRPVGFSKGPTDYHRLLERNDVDAVLIATPVPLHAPMAVDAMKAGKHALSEVVAATTLDECWALVETAEKTGRIYMMAENCCYMRPQMMILNMVRKGVFGDCTYAECGYVHDCRNIKFEADGSLTWRGEMARDRIGNLYPTHSLGPVAQWLGINRGDRMVSLVAMTTRQMGLERYAARRFGADSAPAKIKFAVGDSTTTLIQTANGVVIDLRYDTISARPHPTTCYYGLQGTTASYDSDGEKIWIDGKSKENTWEPLSKYAEEYDHPMWKKYESEAQKTEHGGGDFFPIREFVRAIRTGGPSPVDVYDAVTWSSIVPLSAESLRGSNKRVEIPDYTRGKWKSPKA